VSYIETFEKKVQRQSVGLSHVDHYPRLLQAHVKPLFHSIIFLVVVMNRKIQRYVFGRAQGCDRAPAYEARLAPAMGGKGVDGVTRWRVSLDDGGTTS
jgi:hypothetical protein